MRTHELARLLLELPDAALTVTANGHQYTPDVDAGSHGALRVERIHHYAGGYRIAIGNGLRDNGANWHPHETLKLWPESWPVVPPRPARR